MDEHELPFKLPPGLSRKKKDVADYMCSMARDRVNNILAGICSACNQAGAWIELACFEEEKEAYGLIDHAGQLLQGSRDSDDVIFSTYSMEERRKAEGPEAENFVKALVDFAGDSSNEQSTPGKVREPPANVTKKRNITIRQV